MGRKNPCKEGPGFACPDCGKRFTRAWTRDRHRLEGLCPARQRSGEAAAEKELRELEARAAELRLQVGGGRAAGAAATTNITNNTQNNITNNTIVFNAGAAPAEQWPAQHAFGREDISYITPAWLKRAFHDIPLHLPADAAGQEMVSLVMNAIWADGKDHPENLTVVLTTPRGDPLVFERGEWRTTPMDRVLKLMQSQAVDLIANAPRARPTDKDIQKGVADGEGGDEFFRTAKATLKNAQEQARAHRGRLPDIGVTGAVLPPPAALRGPEHQAVSAADRFEDGTRLAIAKGQA